MSYHNEDPTANFNLQESTKNRRLEQTKREDNRRVNSRVKKHQLFPILLICTYSSEGFPKMHLEDRRRERGGWLYRELQSKMHRWILYGNVYQRHMKYTPSWNIETKVGGGLMHAFKYFFYHVLVFCWLCFASLIQGSTVSPRHRWLQEVSICWTKEQPITRSDGQWQWIPSCPLDTLFFLPLCNSLLSPVLYCFHLCLITNGHCLCASSSFVRWSICFPFVWLETGASLLCNFPAPVQLLMNSITELAKVKKTCWS